jgi:hypothetical protein
MVRDDVRYVRAISPSEPSLAPAPRYWNIGRDSLYNGGLRASWRRHDRDRRQSLFEQVRTTAFVQRRDLSFGTLRDMCGTAVLRTSDKIMTDWKYASPFCIEIKRGTERDVERNECYTRARYKLFFSSYEWQSYVEFSSFGSFHHVLLGDIQPAISQRDVEGNRLHFRGKCIVVGVL